MASWPPWARRAATVFASTGVLVSIAVPARVSAAAGGTLADWRMDEPPGSSVMLDSSGNGLDGAIGDAVLVGQLEGDTVFYRWPYKPPNQLPVEPERLIQVADARLNPGLDDYAIALRFRTSRSFGNILQKGQAGSPTGYFKMEIPNGNLRCVFRGLDANGELVRVAVASGDARLNDGAWHSVRCMRTGEWLTLVVDGRVLDRRQGAFLSITNRVPFVIGGKLNCDQVRITCDYFTGDIDSIRIEKGGISASALRGEVLFADGFDGGFAQWSSVVRMELDAAQGTPAPSAFASVADASAFATAPLVAGTWSVCASVDVLAPDLRSATLLRLRAAGGAPIIRVRVDANGFLLVRSDVSGLASPRTVPLGSGWHTIRLCGTIGSEGTWSLTRDGITVLEDWDANTGSAPAGVVQIGETARGTWTANFDGVLVEDVFA